MRGSTLRAMLKKLLLLAALATVGFLAVKRLRSS
jgi:hypothetical protein